MALTSKLIGLFLLIGLIPLTIIGWLGTSVGKKALMQKSYAQLESVRDIKKKQIEKYFMERQGDLKVLVEILNILRQDTFDKLSAIQAIKKKQIENYISEKLGNAAALSGNDMVLQALNDFETALETGGNNDNAWNAADTAFSPWLKKYSDLSGCYNLFLISSNGDVVYTQTKEIQLGTNLVTGQLNDSALGRCFSKAKQEVWIEDVSPFAPSKNEPFLGSS